MSRKIIVLAALALIAASGPAAAQQAPAQQAPAAQPATPPAPPPQYGAPISVADAKKLAAAAIAEVGKIGAAPNAIAIVDIGGELLYFERMENTQTGSVQVAIDKARSAVLFRRPTKVFEDVLAGGGAGLRILGLHAAIPVEGGLPIVVGGKVVGAIGASGGTAAQDGQVALAGLNALK
jgi:glc operon protein GlcG